MGREGRTRTQGGRHELGADPATTGGLGSMTTDEDGRSERREHGGSRDRASRPTGGRAMTEPRTAAGRALVAAYAAPEDGRSIVIETVLRCEAEARAAALDEARAAVAGIGNQERCFCDA